MSDPKQILWDKLKRLARYLIYKPSLDEENVNIYSDSDWAGNKKTRKPVSGGVVMWGDHYIKSWSRGQSVIALSSAEAEFYAAVKATCEGIGIINIMAEWEVKVSGSIYADASAALGIINRSGVGKSRHLETQHL